MSAVRRLLPPFIAAFVLVLHAGLMYLAALRHTHGVVSYPIDDTFIHLALAKHIALDGTYGVNAGEFTAASSSVGWPLLLAAAIKVAGLKPWLPLLLNGVFGVALAFVVDAVVRRLGVLSVVTRTLIGVAVVELTPMPTLVVLGMEHTAHIAANIALIGVASVWLADSRERPGLDATVFAIAALAFNASFWRYEGAFPTGIIAGLALLRRRPKAAACILASGAIPGVLFGLYAKAKGSLFLPVPIVLKGRHFDEKLGDILGIDLMDRLGTEAAILVVATACAVVLALLVRSRGFWSPLVIALATTLSVMLVHLNFASIGWFYRYEAYLLATGITFSIAGFATLLPEPRDVWRSARREPVVAASALASVFLVMPLRKRAVIANEDTAVACRNVFEQQMQSARFLSRFETPVAVNDLGAVAWLRDQPVIDLVGLGNLPIAKAKGLKLMQPLKTEDVARFTRDVEVAIIYDEWFSEPLPPTWLRVARWRIEDNRTCASSSVSIYATNPLSYADVITKLRAYEPELPPKVARSGRFRYHPHDHDHVRSGDVVVVSTQAHDIAGAYSVDEDGRVYLPKAKPLPVLVAGATASDLDARFADVLHGRPGPARLSFVSTHGPRVTVVGGAGGPVESPATSFADALATAAAVDDAGLWLWRERPDGSFAKLTRSELGDRPVLEDGDIVIAP